MKLIVLAIMLQACSGAGTVGSFQEQEVDADTLTMANFAVPLIQGEIGSDRFFTLKSVDNTQHQIVAGKNYKMDLTLVETDCAHDIGVEGLKCSPVEQARTVRCNVVVYDVPWSGKREVTEKQCSVL